jgi:pimeloyl-ACP methyl ester carboxylesterase
VEPPIDIDKAPSQRLAATGRWWCCSPLSLSALATTLAEFLADLGLHQVTVVCNDWSGAQLLISPGGSDRLANLVLVSCAAFDNYPPGLPGRLLCATAALRGGTFLASQVRHTTRRQDRRPRRHLGAEHQHTARDEFIDRSAALRHGLPCLTSRAAVRPQRVSFAISTDPRSGP